MGEKDNQVVLLGTWACAYCRRVELALKLKGIPYKYMEEDLSNKSDLLLTNNPVKKVPVLLHNEKAIAESLVILEYIDETWGHTSRLLPHDPHQRAKIRFWVNYHDQKIIPAIYTILRSKGKEREKAIEKVNELVAIFIEGIEKDFAEEFLYSKGIKTLGLLDIVVGANSTNYKAIKEATKMEMICPQKNFEFLSWENALNGHPLIKELQPPLDKLVAKLIEKFGTLN
ncbi:glutathione S-transferase U10-like [Neltuma alba]|uniref:glutathione S-transferase U10-like n=1 Tax=Neltuma alba TaxID=207710 RepID=UPI0010A533FA|nr:glutathione S-transferase U10-like [Prosopis alba]